MRIGVPGLQLQGLGQAMFDLATETLCERLDHRDALTVTTEREGMQVPCVDISRRLFLLLLAALRNLHQQTALFLVIRLEIRGIDRRRLVGRVITREATSQADLDSLAKVAGVITPPGLLYSRILGKRLAVAAMQPRPVHLQCRSGIEVCLVRIGKLVPGH
ncbi:MAG: hypothetical protein AW09_003837 [Candidatus Accumulibacter phosphatis]|uniref:Uncharacterized protein n=1 Tax=Candidatus Accumulibacter phosphatis TaxID=327160 RepID=A0A080LRV9_9PROT|nr:MAG: hypothetical protein AW09_003837 [Candidatus Accumulibacter phosphatis]